MKATSIIVALVAAVAGARGHHLDALLSASLSMQAHPPNAQRTPVSCDDASAQINCGAQIQSLALSHTSGSDASSGHGSDLAAESAAALNSFLRHVRDLYVVNYLMDNNKLNFVVSLVW
jgi:hypothetical protein